MYKKFIKTIPLSLKLLFTGSLSIVLIQELFLYSVEPLFSKAYEIAAVFEKILLSIIASIIFHLITQHVPKINKKSKSAVFINNFAFEIRILSRDIVRTIYEMKNEKYIDDEKQNSEEEICKRIDAKSLRSKVTFSYDEIEYDNWLHLLIRVKTIINETNSVITPYNDIMSKEALESLLNMVQIINIRIHPESKINTKTTISAEYFSDLINQLVSSGYKFCEEVQKNTFL